MVKRRRRQVVRLVEYEEDGKLSRYANRKERSGILRDDKVKG